MKRFVFKSIGVLFVLLLVFAAGLVVGACAGYAGNNYIRTYVDDPGSIQKLTQATGAFVSTLKEDNNGVIKGRIIKVTDGDTLKVVTSDGTVTVRLFGIDAPEAPGNKKSGQPMWDLSVDIINEQIKNNMSNEVYIVPIDIDRYGRTVGLVYTVEVLNAQPKVEWIMSNTYSWNELIVMDGGAEVYHEYLKDLKNKEVVKRFVDLEIEAKENRLGIWNLKNYERPSEFRKRRVN
jgi:micrococcal nuclease